MPLLDRVEAQAAERQLRRAADPVTMQEFGAMLGQLNGGGRTKAGVQVGAYRALGISAWYRGVRYLTDTIASLPVHTYRTALDGSKSRRSDPLWMKRPDTETPWFALVESWMMSELHRGNAYSFKIRNAVEQVVGLRPIHPDRVRCGIADGVKVFEVDGRKDVGFTSREILHLPGLSYNGVTGLDPLTIMAEGLGRAAAADEYASRSLGQGSHLQAYLSLPQQLTDDEAEALKARWQQFHSGMTDGREFGVLGNGAEYKTVSLTPEQQQLLETRKFEVTELARFLGVVPHKLYDLEHATFSNIEHQAIEAVVDGIRPWVERFEAWLNFDPHLLPAGNVIEFQLDALLRGDSAARAAFYNAGVLGGWLMPSAAAKHENEPSPPELDYYLRPLNYAVIRPGMAEETTAPPNPLDRIADALTPKPSAEEPA